MIIGGSRLPAVEVNLDVLDTLGQPSPYADVLTRGDPRWLLVPGTSPPSLAPIKLIPPSEEAALGALAPASGTVVVPTPLPEPEPTDTAVPAPAAATPEPPPPAPTPLPEPTRAASATQTAVAALPPSVDFDVSKPGRLLRIGFDGSETEVPEAVKPELKALAAKFATSDVARAQLKAYAGGTSGTVSAARRLSLSRALSVRAFLLDQGVRSTRIDVRALGNKSEGGPPDRVDIFLLPR
ncbi:MAG: OmpA family protein [Alphaproteobacteria bacterium]